MEIKIQHVFAVISVLSVGVSRSSENNHRDPNCRNWSSVNFILLNVRGDVDCSQHPPHVHPKMCCPVPNLIADEVLEKCKQTNNMPPPPPPSPEEHNRGHHHHNHCFPSCFFNETGILVDGQLDKVRLETYLNDNLRDAPAMIPILQESFEECYDRIDEIMENIRNHFENEQRGPPRHGHGAPDGRCPPQSGILMKCAMIKTLKECPASIWTDTDECNAARDFFTECMPPPEEEDEE